MSQASVELALAVMEALGRRDADRLIMSDLQDAWETVRAEVDQGLGVGDVAVLVGRIHYRGQGSGIETETAAGWTLKFRREKLVRFRAFRHPDKALEAVGLSG